MCIYKHTNQAVSLKGKSSHTGYNFNADDCDDPSIEEAQILSDLTNKASNNIKKVKRVRMVTICQKELQMAEIKINHEIEICKQKEEFQEMLFKMTREKLILEQKELKERLKLSKYLAQKEMGSDYNSD
ncbi:uncharacterized protein [Prorops nasuta]|uniref:uncharacterized protein isoform X2 n=1 Tax=Prorops nasuta TaxID=863751 RepID=UPI0034CE04FF